MMGGGPLRWVMLISRKRIQVSDATRKVSGDFVVRKNVNLQCSSKFQWDKDGRGGKI